MIGTAKSLLAYNENLHRGEMCFSCNDSTCAHYEYGTCKYPLLYAERPRKINGKCRGKISAKSETTWINR